MTAESQASPDGVERTDTGTIVDQTPSIAPAPEASPATTTPSETTPEKPSLLNEKGPAEPKPVEPAKGAPETYADYKVPEGFVLDKDIKAAADGIFKGLGLSQEQAQSLVDFYVKQSNDAHEAPFKAWDDMTSKWRSDAESHPALRGKLGAGQEVNVRIGKFLDGINDPQLVSDFKSLMDLTGAGNHPAFIRVLDYAAKQLTEGSHVAGNGPTKASQSEPNRPPPGAAAAMWPNLPSANAGR